MVPRHVSLLDGYTPDVCKSLSLGVIVALSTESPIDSEGFKGGTRGSPIMPRDAVSRTANVGAVGINGLRIN